MQVKYHYCSIIHYLFIPQILRISVFGGCLPPFYFIFHKFVCHFFFFFFFWCFPSKTWGKKKEKRKKEKKASCREQCSVMLTKKEKKKIKKLKKKKTFKKEKKEQKDSRCSCLTRVFEIIY